MSTKSLEMLLRSVLSLQERRNRRSRTESMEIVETTEESADTGKRPSHAENHTKKSEKTHV